MARAIIGLALAFAAAGLLASLPRMSMPVTVLWSLALVFSFVGWGSLVNLWLAPARAADWGLRAGWGMAFSLFVGGYLVLARIAYGPVLVVMVALGVITFIIMVSLQRPPALSRRKLVVVLAHAGLGLLIFAGYVLALTWGMNYAARHDFQPSDDPPLYFVLAKKIVDNGTIYEPFNPRRISTLGGQQLLHALFISVGSLYYLFVVDCLIATLIVLALVLGMVRGPAWRSWHAVPVGLSITLLFTLTNVRVNSASLMTGVAMILTLYRTLRFPFEGGTNDRAATLLSTVAARLSRPRAIAPSPGTRRVPLDVRAGFLEPRRLAVLGVLTCLPIVLRTSTIAAVLPFMCMALASDALLTRGSGSTRTDAASFARGVGIFAACFLVTLLPWSLVMHRSCGTYFYPLGHNNLTPGWEFLKRAEGVEPVLNFISNFTGDRPISTFVPFAVAGLVPLAARARNDVVSLTLGTLIGMWVLAREASLFDANAVARYYYAFEVATALAVTGSACSGARRGRDWTSLLVLPAVGIAVNMACSRDEIRRDWVEAVGRLPGAVWESRVDKLAWEAETANYREIQSHTLPGTTIATALHDPFRFDFTRNEIQTLDELGSMGPAPGWPLHKGSAALADYFRANGIRYVAWYEFDQANELYNRPHWRGFLGNRSYLGYEAPFHLDGMDAVEGLTAIRHVVYRGHHITVVDLQASP